MNPFKLVAKWTSNRSKLLKELEQVKSENFNLRSKILGLQKARDTAEQSAQERRREKEVLRNRIAAQKVEVDAATLAARQAALKATELRDENERLRNKQKR